MPESAPSSKSTDTPTAGFAELALDPTLLRAVDKLGFETMTPIQAAAIPVLLEGRDVIGRARTGSGKTAAFGLPLLNHVRGNEKVVQALVLTPTRELALQVSKALTSFAVGRKVDVLTIYGGAPFYPQLKALSRGVQVVVGTPGRVLDHIRRGSLDLSGLEFFVLDEADEMLSMGFIEDIEEILAGAPKDRQSTLFSATMAPQMRRAANKWLRDPREIQVESGNLSVGHITQQWMRVSQRDKLKALIRVLDGTDRGTTLVFVRTKKGCAEVSDELSRLGYPVDALHGDLNQSARERVTQRLRNGVLEIVIATDVAARGIDIDHITHVINLDLPNDAESYVHRIGRTGRAGRDGTAISFATPAQARSMPSLARKLKAEISQTRVPSQADIRRRQSEAIRNHIGATVGEDELAPARKWVADALANEEWTVEELAAAAVHLLAKANGIEMTDAPPEPALPPRRDISHLTKDQRIEAINEIEVFLPIGRSQGIRPATIVGVLTNEAGMRAEDIGRINVENNKTFIGMSKHIAEAVVREVGTVSIGHRNLQISMANARHDQNQNRGPRRPKKQHRGR